MSRTLELLESHVSDRTQWHFVVLRDADHLALGECSDSGHPANLVTELELAAGELRGRDLLADRADIVDALARRAGERARPDAFVGATLMGGLEQLLTDHAAQAAGEPVWKWLGGSAPAPVRLYANINRVPGGRTPDDVAAAAMKAVTAGFSAVKCAPFDVPDGAGSLAATGLRRLRAIREAVGDDIELRVDCHERLPVEQIHRLLPALEDLGIGWLEDAVAMDQTRNLRALRAATTIPLAGGELMFHAAEADAAVSEGLIDVLMPDVKHAGGIERVLSIARGVPELAVSPHNPSGPVATAAAAHLFAVCPNATDLEYQFGETPWRSDLVGSLERIAEGHLHADDRPGLGLTLNTRHPSLRVLWSTTL
ncbi:MULTISPECIES: mandelate racemase/muconate lactonizing enzyme family protein [unclassified Streptomyces]|uniref:mandelate racemase/muconate lactonizing enzyme family protein n=1 Tax=unclassified Streptomyces TaxID=2593676 RepID=UPI002741D112|nr:MULTISPECIES: mandelate racemase/muconate lactonizing enzyme family protein [unclassified Streptomyces]